MKRFENIDFTEGTLVFLSGLPAYGVVANKEAWIEEAEDEDLDKIVHFKVYEEAPSVEVIPVFLFGNFIGSKLIPKTKGQGFIEAPCLERFTYSNVGGDISIISRIDRLQTIIWHQLTFYGNQVTEYAQQVSKELKVLKCYFEDQEVLSIPGNVRLFKRFQKILPNGKL